MTPNAATTPAPVEAAKLLTRNFWLIALAATSFFASYHLLSPSLPLYLRGQEALGVILAAFMASSLLLRPWVGHWCDTRSCRASMVLGAGIFALCPGFYPWAAQGFWPLLLLRLLHGAGLALFYTAASALISREIPPARRAEGMGHFGNAIKLAMAFSPALGLYLVSQPNPAVIFPAAALLGVVPLVCALLVREKTPQAQGSSEASRRPALQLINGAAIFPGVVMGSNSLVFGTLIPFAPMIAQEKGLGDAGWFYTLYAVSLILSRAVTGPISDRYGRSSVLIPGILGVALSLLALMLSSHPAAFLLAAVCYGLCAGTVQPSLMALTADRVPPERRGSAMATFSLFTDLGIMLGTALTGTLGPRIGFANSLVCTIVVVLLGLLYYLWERTKAPRTVLLP